MTYPSEQKIELMKSIMNFWTRKSFKFFSQEVNFINILPKLFLPMSFHQKITKPKCNREKLRKVLSCKKHAPKSF